MEQLKRLLLYLKPYRWKVVLALILSFGVAGLTSLSLSSLIPILEMLFEEGGLVWLQSLTLNSVGKVSTPLAEWMVANLFVSRMAALTTLIVLVMLITVVKGTLRFLNGYLVGTVAVGASRDLQNQLFGHLLGQPVLFLEKEGVGNLSSRFTADGDEVVRALKTFTGTLFREPLQFFCLLTLALLISPPLTLAALVIFPLMGVLIRKAGRIAKRNARGVLAHRSRLLTILQETFLGIRVVQACRGEARVRDEFVDENQHLYDRNRSLVRVEAITAPIMEILVVLGVGGALLLGGAMALRGDISASRLVVLYIAVGALYEPVRKMASAVPRVQSGLAGATRIFAYLDREEEVRESPDARPMRDFSGAIRFEGVTCTYGGAAEALCNVDLTIPAGETTAIVGPSGSGKSTLAGLLPRFFDPEEGTVLFDGTDIRTLTLESLRGSIALVPQDTFLLDDTVRANIAFARADATDEEIMAAAREARVDEFVMKLPKQWESRVGERGTTLSGGQRQRIAIARALLARPRILILDEAISHVDEESALRIREALIGSGNGRTTIIITHRIEALGDADRIAVLKAGRVEAVGKRGELEAMSPTFRDLLAAATAARTGSS